MRFILKILKIPRTLYNLTYNSHKALSKRLQVDEVIEHLNKHKNA